MLYEVITQVLLGFLAETLLDRADVVHEFDGLLVTDIVDPPRRVARARVGLRGVPVLVRRCRMIARADHALDDVVDVGEIAPMLAVVENVDRLALKDIAREQA